VHPFVELSAYIDDALDSSAKAAVGTHLGSCAVCRTRLAELRDTARPTAAPAFAPVSNASRERPAGPAGAAGPTGAADQRTSLTASASPAAGFAVNASPTPVPAPEAQRSLQTDATKAVTGTAAPAAQRGENVTTSPVVVAYSAPERPQLGPSPWIWLVLAVGFGALAFVLQRRLRAR